MGFIGKNGKVIIPTDRTLSQLKPCPFCGEKGDMLIQEYGWLVLCWGRCGGQMRVHTKYITQAVAAWNHRSDK
jgi:hypothetical protein